MNISYETIISKIITSTSLPKEQIELKINQKLKDLQDLISREGAAHIVANELNVKLFDSVPKYLKIKDITPGLNSVTLTARIITINETRSYKKNNREGRIGSILMGDETGTMRLVIWDQNLINEIPKLKEGDILKVLNAYSKENNGYKELHLGSKSQWNLNPPNETIGEIKINMTSKRKELSEVKQNEFVEVLGYIVQVFEPKFYNACPVCNKKVMQTDEKFICREHGAITANKVPILNIFLDDGTGNIRAVLFRDLAEKVLGKEPYNFEEIKKSVLGKQFSIKGKINKNEMFDRLELMATSLEEPDPMKLVAQLENVN